ncbi:MAG: HAD hydrolase-like protein [Lachnospiraceae bacterium]|nr:HAD hydrolase-like protein [Lachnospiraceae bacterium]
MHTSEKAVLFDLDGTLIDSSEGITKAVQYALRHYGIEEPDLDKLRGFIGPPLGGSFQKYYGFSREQGQEAIGVYREYYRPRGIFECCLYPGVETTIRELKARGYRIGLASSKPEIFCRQILEHFDILELFDEVGGATEDERIVTKEDVLAEVMHRMGEVPKERIWLIGDTVFDIEGANQAGIRSIGVSYGFGDTQEMMAKGALAICDELPGILEYL